MRLYIINSTDLIPIAQKQARILDFAPVETKVAINVMGASPDGRKILVRKRDNIEDFSYAIEFDKAIHPAIAPGTKLDAMNRLAIHEVSTTLELLATRAPRTLKLFEWIKKEITLVTTKAVYGPKNPFNDAKIQNAYWYVLSQQQWHKLIASRKFERGIIILLLDLYPTILVSESIQARKDIVQAFYKYFVSRGHDEGSAFVQAHYQHKIDQGATGKDIARFEIGAIVAILSNTVPAAFWVLFHAISDATILEECRQEVLACCRITGDTYTLDITEVKKSCPILLSILKEALRFHGIGTSVRVVTQDHLLNGEYLLKKGGIVMIPGPVQHSLKSVYGETVAEFQHKRFVRTPGQKRLNPIAFRGFGGGSTLCPGRHFASTEVIAFVALAIVRFDFKPSSGEWICPKTDKAGMQGTIAPPNDDVEVQITPIAGKMAGQKWNVLLSRSDEGVELSAEDMY
jgi:cytochrome P450